MKRSLRVVLTLCLIALASTAWAEARTFMDAKMQMDLPAGWSVKTEGPVTAARSQADDAALLVVVVDAADMKKAGDQLDALLAKKVKNLTWEDKKEGQVNGLPAVSLKGTATMNDKPVSLGVAVVLGRAGKGLIVLGAVETARKDAYKGAVSASINSIKAVQ